MQRDARTVLLDAIASGDRIESWTRAITREAFFADRRTQAAVDLRVVWSLARHELPALLTTLRRILAETP